MFFSYLTLTDRKQTLPADFRANRIYKMSPKSLLSEVSGRKEEEECVSIVPQNVTIFTIKYSYYHNKNIFIFVLKIQLVK